MRKLFLSLFIVASLAITASSQFSSPDPFAITSVRTPDASTRAVHQIELISKSEDRACSSTAVGKHTLLSAAHCMVGTASVTVDGNERRILASMYDENDHVLLVVDGPEFPMALILKQREPVKGEHVHIWGWPGDATTPVYRDGYFTGVDQGKRDILDVWLLPVFHGDSGSGLVADDGTVINVVSLGNGSAQTMTFPMVFTPSQLQGIQ